MDGDRNKGARVRDMANQASTNKVAMAVDSSRGMKATGGDRDNITRANKTRGSMARANTVSPAREDTVLPHNMADPKVGMERHRAMDLKDPRVTVHKVVTVVPKAMETLTVPRDLVVPPRVRVLKVDMAVGETRVNQNRVVVTAALVLDPDKLITAINTVAGATVAHTSLPVTRVMVQPAKARDRARQDKVLTARD